MTVNPQNHDETEAGREKLAAALDAAAASTRMRTATVNAARLVILNGATFADAARKCGMKHRQQVGEAVARLKQIMRDGLQPGEKKRCAVCGSVLNLRGKHGRKPRNPAGDGM